MKRTMRLIRRFLMLALGIGPILLILNLALFIAFTWREKSGGGGWDAAKEVGEELALKEDGSWSLSDVGEQILTEYRAWGILVENGTGDVIWHSGDLPEEIPLHYSLSEISWYTRGYIADYPTTVGARGDDLVILGHPKDAYWKLLWNSFDYDIIAGMPRMILSFLGMNAVLIFVIYMILATRILRSVKPVVQGMEALPEREVYVGEEGFLAEVAAAVNRVNEKLRAQERNLRKKENARAGWISGISHDIRTPLTMVMGYAAEIEEDASLPVDTRRKAEVIRRQSLKMKELVGNLNLASKLEYQMQPVKTETVNLAAVLRQAVADFVNLDLDGKYPVDFDCDEKTDKYILQGDKELLQRAVCNVLTNSQLHNPEGCHIGVNLHREAGAAHIVLEDDGTGVTDEQLAALQSTPHYMMDSGNGSQLRHGLGLVIVRQIAAAHGGWVRLDHGENGGFLVEIVLKCL
ncbi:sensor histidine kinase [Acetatifactor aquisgranensis]|uniref:sensor histidine kinase n=1 Tax=Acetatifactor aquisgranensis TaxID=2941233 RepID=UPI0020415468|nr:HAMP domain-containing sensor histidine kinase [Acetatifactor aquisgranensis]